MDYLSTAKAAFDTEIAGLIQLRDRLGEPFIRLVDLCLKTLDQDGKLVICGLGKSGHIGHKIAATLASTGAPAAFLHPVEAMHGDLGMLQDHDLLIVLSYSGETDELVTLLPAAKRMHIPVVALTGDPRSRLAHWSDLVVPLTIPAEACPFNLAPTTSTTAMLAFGDALAIVLMGAQKFSREDYGRLHPAGAIGRAVTLRVRDVMRGLDRTPIVPSTAKVKDALLRMTECRSGSVLVTEGDGLLAGIFTDGDFRRHAQHDLRVLEKGIAEVMTARPIRIRADEMAIAIVRLLEQREIDDIPVVDDTDHVVGLVDIQDLPKFKLM